MNDKWSENSFLLCSNSLANHGGQLSCFFYYLPTNNPQAGYQYVGNKNSPYIWINHLLSQQLPIFLPTYVRDLFPTELVTKVKPNNNSVEVIQLSNSGHPVDGAMLGAGSLWPTSNLCYFFTSPTPQTRQRDCDQMDII